ncbi:type II secretion system protein [Coxiella-like endosymbiont]|uniref:type II secretion system protein n=1 Tax=Coxiella-like endosymbiont TaxID=1592897 RepID=UPI0034E2C82F
MILVGIFNYKKLNSQQGFTLIEVLVALIILAMVLTVVILIILNSVSQHCACKK